MVGGAADLVESAKTTFAGESSFSRARAGRNVHWAVREHAMGPAVNGLALHGGIVKPYGLPVLDRCELADARELRRGAYVLAESRHRWPDAALVATGSEVEVALDAQAALAEEAIEARVVSMPSWELFEAQPDDDRDAVLPPGLPIVSVEAGVALGWPRYAPRSISVERFGASAPGPEVFARLGVTAEAVAAAVRSTLIEASFA